MKALRPGTSQTLIVSSWQMFLRFSKSIPPLPPPSRSFPTRFRSRFQGFDFSSAFEGEFGSFEGGEGKSAAVVTNAK